MMNQNNTGPWETDQWGRRFRRIGHSIEYEMMVTIDGVEVPESQVEEHNRQTAERMKELRQQENATLRSLETGRICPLKASRGQVEISCKADCLWYDGVACVLLGLPADRDTEGSKCPLGGTCRKNCAAYDRGCTIPNRIRAITRKEN